ncbi:het domain protein [Botrytis cinerea]
MSQYSYSTDPLDSDSIRLLGLMPDKDLTSPIHCRLHDYSLRESDRGIHLYEALSYVWGSLENLKVVYVNNRSLSVTANLYAALLHLRDRNFERIIWVDSICINQEDNTEKSHQIQLMAKIFGLANRVIVYLGEAADDSDQALESIRVAAEEAESEGINETSQRGILKLLKRPWFQRIWVLQEVGFAQQILIMCGSATIDGHTFSMGFGQLFYKDHSELPNLIRPVIYLIRGAIFRPKYAIRPSGALSLGELIDMYHTRMATKLHDKIYALLSMSSDTSNVAGLSPDYRVTWTTLLERLVKFVLFKDVSVKAWEDEEIVLIESKGYVLGHVSSIDADSTRYDRQYVSIVSINQSEFDNEEHTTRWLLHASAKPIRQGDLVCLLQGASKPSIIRAYRDHFSIIVIAVTLQDKIQRNDEWFESLRPLPLMKKLSRDFLLFWNWEKSPEELQGQAEDGDTIERYTSIPECLKTDTKRAINSINVALVLGDTIDYANAERILQRQIKDYDEKLRGDNLHILALKESLGWICYKRNDTTKAENLFLEVVETRKAFQGRYHQDTLSSMARLGFIYMVKSFSLRDEKESIIRLSDQIGNNNQISEKDMIRVGELKSHKMMELLLELKRDNVEVTEEVVKAAVGNWKSGYELMKLLFDKRDEEITVTEEIVKIAVGNKYKGHELIKLLFDKRSEEITITEEILKAAASNYNGKKIMEFILEKRGEEIIITEEILKAAIRIDFGRKDIMELILEKREEVIITEEILKAAASSYNGQDIMEVILEKREEVIITEEILKAAVSNYYGERIIGLILEKGEEVIITEEILKAAASNFNGRGIIEPILEKRGEEIIITEEILKAAASNEYGKVIIELILEKREEVIITEEVLEAARKNKGLGLFGMALLLVHQAKHAIVPKKRIKTATIDE